MKIIGIEGLSDQEINYEIQRGGKFVVYKWTYRRKMNDIVVVAKNTTNICPKSRTGTHSEIMRLWEQEF